MLAPFQDAESAAKVASNLERLRKDMGKGKPVPLKKKGMQESRQQTGAGSGVELQPGGAEDSDDLSEDMDEGWHCFVCRIPW